jgi:hypothetical protein
MEMGSPEFRERTLIRPPSPREAVGSEASRARSRGRGWGVYQFAPLAASLPRHPPPPTSRASFARLGPRHAQGRVGGGEFKSGARLSGTTIVSDSNFKQRICVRSLAARSCPSFALSLTKGGSRECRMRAAPAVSCAKMCERNAHEHTGSAEALRHSLRNGFTAYFALSPENRALLSPSSANSWLIRARSGRLAFSQT